VKFGRFHGLHLLKGLHSPYPGGYNELSLALATIKN